MSGQIASIDEIKEKFKEAKRVVFKHRIDELAEVYGSVRAVGRALNIDHAYLQRIRAGEKENPSDVVLKKLGLK